MPGNRAPVWDALLFDFDGVLADTERSHHASWNQVLKPHGIQFTWDEYLKQCVGIADVMVAHNLGLPDAAEAVARKQQAFRDALELTPPFLPQTRQLLSDLSGMYRMAVVSSSYRTEIEPPLRRAGLFDYFEMVLCGDDVPRLKPAPDPYRIAAERLAVKNPLVIEDSDAGVASGRAAGFSVLRIVAVEQTAAQVREALDSGSVGR